jgi:NAD(P)-dependent dehydrogenase (short-subunit alcohol dehydrogenase family)
VELDEKVALVTGAGAGIGRATALRLAREGAAVVIADVDEEGASNTVRVTRSEGGQAAFIVADVASEADVSNMVAFAEAEFGRLDVLVNNAGGVTEPYFPEGEPEHWGRAIDLKYFALSVPARSHGTPGCPALLACRFVLPRHLARWCHVTLPYYLAHVP